jgi:hypothetical protein
MAFARLGRRQRGQQQRGQYGNNGNDHQQFNQCKRAGTAARSGIRMTSLRSHHAREFGPIVQSVNGFFGGTGMGNPKAEAAKSERRPKAESQIGARVVVPMNFPKIWGGQRLAFTDFPSMSCANLWVFLSWFMAPRRIQS